MRLPSVMIVEDDQLTALDLEAMLHHLGYQVAGIAASGSEALDLAAARRPGLVLMDMRLDGIATAERLQALHPVPIVYLAAHAEQPSIEHATRGAVESYLLKPVAEHELQAALTLAIIRHALERHARADERRFRSTLQGMADAILVTDRDGRVVFLNAVARAMLGGSAEEPLQRPLHEVLTIVDGDSGRPIDALAARVLRSGQSLRLPGPTLLHTAAGQALPVDVHASAIHDEADSLSGVVVVVRDLSDRLGAEEAVRKANVRLQATVEALERRNAELQVLQTLASNLQLAETSAEACVAIAAAVRQFFPQDAGTLLLRRASDGLLEPVFTWGNHPEMSAPLPVTDCQALHERKIVVSGDDPPCTLCQRDMLTQSGETCCVPLATADQAIGVLLLGQGPPATASAPQPATEALADRRRLATALATQAALGLANVLLRDRLREQAIRDPLTGLFNRRYLDETLLRELAKAERGRYPIGLIMLDIDHFKRINDTYGHPAGDTLLRAVGALLRSQVRTGDIACRYGGEEFLLVLPTASGEAAAGRAEALRQAIAQLQLEHEGRRLPTVTLSAGVTALYDADDGVEAALDRADQALYAAKAAGRDRVAIGDYRTTRPE